MRLIHFEGLNCYYNSIVSIAQAMGADVVSAFGTLWSEADFLYDPFRNAFSSRRFLENLAFLGVRLETLPSAAPEERARSLARLEESAFLVVGMDAFFLPWSPRAGLFHGSHYFAAVNAAPEWLLCYDPTYGKADERFPAAAAVDYANDLILVSQCPATGAPAEPFADIQAAARESPALRQRLLGWCEKSDRKEIEKAARYVDCLISNRLLYRHCLARRVPALIRGSPLEDEALCERWNAVKNGFLKASLTWDFASVLREVREQITLLTELELCAAQTLCVAVGTAETAK
ncbi:MAG: hypothetical protein LBJ11_06370 [Oscillospiraceae bacterium]|jgi:hypothetical protein|nr:hypothetical protein [Oscillospiraceae bacterium]